MRPSPVTQNLATRTEPTHPGIGALGVALILGTVARVTFVHAQSFTMDEIFRACVEKHAINRARKWGEPDEHGVVEHVRTET